MSLEWDPKWNNRGFLSHGPNFNKKQSYLPCWSNPTLRDQEGHGRDMAPQPPEFELK